MASLDHYSISRALGSTFEPFDRRGFGGTSATRAVSSFLASRPRPSAVLGRQDARDAMIVNAFVEVHRGFSADRVLADPALNAEFIRACRAAGIDAPAIAINKRLLRIRKDASLPVRLPSPTVSERRDSTPWLVAAELAYTRLSYEFDVSMDDLLADPQLGSKFDTLASSITPGGTAVDYRLAALYLRKIVRSRANLNSPLLTGVNRGTLGDRWQLRGSLSRLALADIPAEEGILHLFEPDRNLYIIRHASMRSAFEQFQSGRALALWRNRFWEPTPDAIGVSYIERSRELPALHLVEQKAIQIYEPIFNMRLAA